MKRGVGIGAIKNKSAAQAKFKDKGNELASEQLLQLSSQLETFRINLEDFARKHRDDIRKDPQFRNSFQEMCAAIGVDPLASSKGFWSEMLGVGQFYYELGVQIIEVCMATSHRNGGIISIEELHKRIVKSGGRNRQDITVNDLIIAIKKLKVLHSGFELLRVGNTCFVQSVPSELTMDHTVVLQQAEAKACVSISQLVATCQWDEERARRALEFLVKEGLAWVDNQGSEITYWFAGQFSGLVGDLTSDT